MANIEAAPPQGSAKAPTWVSTLGRVAALILLLYAFLVSIGMIGAAFKAFSGGLIDNLIATAQNPFVGLFVGILATTLVQSSSTTTSLVVALVASGTMPVPTAIPVVMGANIGTSVTNTLVSLGHVTRGREFYRAFSASTVHDFFNILAVIVLFPLQLATNFLGHAAQWLASSFNDVGGMTFASPLKLVTKPAIKWIAATLSDHPWALLILALVIMFVSLRYLVVVLKSLVLARVEALFDLVIFRNAAIAMVFGLVLTTLVQSSSITTSLIIPLAGAGILSLPQIFPYTLGANVGTTVTSILAALATGRIEAVMVSFAHLLFNISGIALIWPIPAVRNIPIKLSRRLARVAVMQRWLPVAYILVFFYALPLLFIVLLR